MLRVLCLHGYHGSGELLRQQMGALAPALAGSTELVFVDAPSLAQGDFGWWHARPAGDDAGGANGQRVKYHGWARTLAWLRRWCAERAPFDGVLGFSQGAALAALLVGVAAMERAAAGATGSPLAFDFAVMVGGFVSADAEHAPLYQALRAAEVPSLHVIGRADRVVSPEASRALAARFAGARVVEHDGGHVMAATGEVRAETAAFLRAQGQRRQGRRGPARRVAAAGAPLLVPLWPGRTHPAMRVHFPDDGAPAATRAALVVFRGGGYARSDGSGVGAAAWAARHGMVGVEVDYRTRADGAAHPAAYADAARAIRVVRRHAAEWAIDPTRVGALGFSAGGHLAALVASRPSLYRVPEDDLAAHFSARPDLLVLAYPLLSFVDGYTPGAFVGSVESFFGRADVTEAERRELSNELHVDGHHPPVFIWTTAEDALVPPDQAEAFVAACRRAHVPVSFTLYPHGPHGLGLALDQPEPLRSWTTQLIGWLDARWPRR